jgi:hypothetical protein
MLNITGFYTNDTLIKNLLKRILQKGQFLDYPIYNIHSTLFQRSTNYQVH